MIDKFVFNAPINPLSMGNVAFNLLKEFYKLKQDIILNPISNFQINSFDKCDPAFMNWLLEKSSKSVSKIKRNHKSFKLWHIADSDSLCTRNQTLYSFYELDSPTETEKNIINLQDSTIFSSSHAENIFKKEGCENVSSVGLGFDKGFDFSKKDYFGEDIVNFTIMGKAEKRKNTAQIINTWIKTFGGKKGYKLTCLVTNPHFKKEHDDNFKNQILQGVENKQLSNVTIVPWLQKNSEVNDFINASDVDLTALSGGEGWNLPAFNAACLGSICVGNTLTSHADWITQYDGFMELPKSEFQKVSAEDGVFFSKNSNYNVGNIYKLYQLDKFKKIIQEAADKVLEEKSKGLKSYKNSKKERGIKLQEKFSYEDSAKQILKIIESA